MTSMIETRALALAIRRHAVRMCHASGGSHVGSSLSVADILAVLYGQVLRHRPRQPGWPGRDRLVLSKGHAAAALYAALAEAGYFPRQWLEGYGRDGGRLCGHVTSHGVPGVELSTGALGHGLPVAVGLALAARLGGGAHRVVCVVSDGELDEGSNWEALLLAGHQRLGRLTAVVDYNKLQSMDTVAATLDLEPLADKLAACGWRVDQADGHDHAALAEILGEPGGDPAAPQCVIAHTTKGKGVSFMENSVLWHYRSPQGEEYAAAMRELGGEAGDA